MKKHIAKKEILSHMIFELLRAVIGLFLLLFIPGYTLTWALYPKKDDIPYNERIAFSFAISISLMMIFVIFMDNVLGVDITPVNIIISIIFLSILFLSIWRLHLYIINNDSISKTVKKIVGSIEKIKNYIKLKYHV